MLGGARGHQPQHMICRIVGIDDHLAVPMVADDPPVADAVFKVGRGYQLRVGTAGILDDTDVVEFIVEQQFQLGIQQFVQQLQLGVVQLIVEFIIEFIVEQQFQLRIQQFIFFVTILVFEFAGFGFFGEFIQLLFEQLLGLCP